jgi:uncharacterized membrane protein
MTKPGWTDRRIEDIVAILLRTGVGLSAAVVFGGGVLYMMRHGTSTPDYRVFHGEPPGLRSLPGIMHSAFTGHSRGIIQLGLLLLIATPVARVVFSIWGFAEEHDHMYTVFTIIVLVILLYSLLGSGWAF